MPRKETRRQGKWRFIRRFTLVYTLLPAMAWLVLSPLLHWVMGTRPLLGWSDLFGILLWGLFVFSQGVGLWHDNEWLFLSSPEDRNS